jgi:hypothetical protein
VVSTRTRTLAGDSVSLRVALMPSRPTPKAGTSLVMAAIPAVAPMVEVDAVFAVAAALRLSYAESPQPGSHNGSHVAREKSNSVSDLQELGG